MSQAGSQAAAFFREVVRTRKVWAMRDAGGFPAPKTPSGVRSMPFWSSESRVRRIVAKVPAYMDFQPVAIDLADWRDEWVPDCERNGYLLGINWSGPRAVGWDIKAEHVLARLEVAERIAVQR